MGCWRAVSIVVLLVACIAPCAHAQTQTFSGLSIDVQKYEPYPASAGDFLDVWIKVENRDVARIEGMEIRIEPEYPLSLLPSESEYRYIGLISVGDAALVHARLVVARDAPDGEAKLKILYRSNADRAWSEVERTIIVGTDMPKSRGTVVLSSYTLYPETLMPGDEGRLDIVLKNTATQRTLTIGDEVFTLDARIQSAELSCPEDVVVESPVYRGVGVLSPGDAITLSYMLHVNRSASEGTRLLNFSVVAGSRAYSTTWKIPLTVEDTQPSIILSKQPRLVSGRSTLDVDVANVRHSTLDAVSVVPESDVLAFEPSEYFVGQMDPNDLFTLQFGVRATKKLEVGERVPISLRVRYQNGDNVHISEPVVVYLTVERAPSGGMAGIYVAVLLVLAAGGVLYYRRQR